MLVRGCQDFACVCGTFARYIALSIPTDALRGTGGGCEFARFVAVISAYGVTAVGKFLFGKTRMYA